MHLLPDGTLFHSSVVTVSGGAAHVGSMAKTFDPTTNSWTDVDALNYGPRGDGYSVLLPGLEKVLVFGGSNLGGTAVITTEMIDLGSSNPQWTFAEPMNHARKVANSVVLPDGTVLAIGGALGPGKYQDAVKIAELFDPVTGKWTDMAAQTAPRMYHSTAVLLPDGRVLSAGHDKGTLLKTAEIYSPPYLFMGARPTITSAPVSMGYSQPLAISTPNAAEIGKVVLIRAPSVTHSTSFDQRYITLPFASGPNVVNATSPAHSGIAPPGNYMMFLINAAGVPSIASWIRVT
jgi:hypothetical protein